MHYCSELIHQKTCQKACIVFEIFFLITLWKGMGNFKIQYNDSQT